MRLPDCVASAKVVWLEDDSAQSITSGWQSHSLQTRVVHRKRDMWRRTAPSNRAVLGVSQPLPDFLNKRTNSEAVRSSH